VIKLTRDKAKNLAIGGGLKLPVESSTSPKPLFSTGPNWRKTSGKALYPTAKQLKVGPLPDIIGQQLEEEMEEKEKDGN
jgi:hypothetical protein